MFWDLYFLFLVNICNGKLSLYYLLCIALGLFIYVKFYAPKFNKFHEKILNMLNEKIFMKDKGQNSLQIITDFLSKFVCTNTVQCIIYIIDGGILWQLQ